MTSEDYLLAINDDFLEYCATYAKKEFFDSKENESDYIKVILTAAYVEALEYYFRTTWSGDDNFWTQTEAEEVIEKLNDLLGTYYVVDF